MTFANIRKRLSNRVTLLAIAGILYKMLTTAGVLPEAPEQYHVFVDGTVTILVLLGIVNDPTTDNKGLGDDA